MNVPNKMTVARIILIPFFVAAFYYEKNMDLKLISVIIFAAASFTDFLDGYIARKYNLVTNLGKFMDPLADKMLTAAAFICLVEQNYIEGFLVLLIISREYAISLIRTIGASSGKIIAASKLGKLKTVTQIISIIMMLAGIKGGHAVFYLCTFITVISGAEYIYINRNLFK